MGKSVVVCLSDKLFDKISLTVTNQYLLTAHWADLAEAVFVVVTTHQNTTAWTLTPPPVIFLVAKADPVQKDSVALDSPAGTSIRYGNPLITQGAFAGSLSIVFLREIYHEISSLNLGTYERITEIYLQDACVRGHGYNRNS